MIPPKIAREGGRWLIPHVIGADCLTDEAEGRQGGGAVPSSLQDFHAHARQTIVQQADALGRGIGDVDHPATDVWATIVDSQDYDLAVREVGDPHLRAE